MCTFSVTKSKRMKPKREKVRSSNSFQCYYEIKGMIVFFPSHNLCVTDLQHDNYGNSQRNSVFVLHVQYLIVIWLISILRVTMSGATFLYQFKTHFVFCKYSAAVSVASSVQVTLQLHFQNILHNSP